MNNPSIMNFPLPAGTVLGAIPMSDIGGKTLSASEQALLANPCQPAELPIGLQQELGQAGGDTSSDEQLKQLGLRPQTAIPESVPLETAPVEQQRAIYEAFRQLSAAQYCAPAPESDIAESVTDVAELTDIDLQAYLVALDGGPLFRKTYSLFGGRIEVTFSDLTPHENDLTTDQADADKANNAVISDLQYCRRLEDYRMAASVRTWQRRDAAPVQIAPLAKLEFTQECHVTALPELYEYVTSSLCQQETVRHAIYDAWKNFQTILAYLEQRAGDPDFFS